MTRAKNRTGFDSDTELIEAGLEPSQLASRGRVRLTLS